jgi:hypothetical protein
MELGLRFYSSPATHDDKEFLTTFIPSTYDSKTAAVMYRPAIDPATKNAWRWIREPAIAPVTYIGLFVPGRQLRSRHAISGKGAPGLYDAILCGASL